MTGDDDSATSLPTTVCPYCGARVPDASYCGACGAHLTHVRLGGAARRTHAYSAFPDESMFRLAVVSSLFPQLAGRSRNVYRAAFAFIVVALAAVAAAGLNAPVIAISAVAVPLLFLIYVWEIDPLEVRFAVPTAIIFVVGAGLGVGWGLLLGPVVSNSLVPRLATSLATGGVLQSALLVPVVGQLLMVLPVAVARLWRPARSEALDGFTAGAAGALGLTLAATLTELTPLLRDGNLVVGSSLLANLTQAVVRGLTNPLIAAAVTGYIGAALWARRGAGSRPAAVGSPSRWWRWRSPWPCRSASATPTTRGSRTSPCSSSTSPRRQWPCWSCGSAYITCCCMRTGTCGSGRPVSARTATGSCPRCRSARCAASPSAPPG